MAHNNPRSKNLTVLFAEDTLKAIAAQQEQDPASLSWIVNTCVLHALKEGYQPPTRKKVLKHRNGHMATDGRGGRHG